VNPRFALFAATVALASLAHVDSAEAGRYRFGGGGHVRVHGNVSVSWGQPAYRPYYGRGWSTGGHIYVGGGYGYYPRYRYYYYQPVPSYYGVYSVEPQYYPVAPAAQPQVAVVAPAARPELPRFGIGLFAGGVSVQDQSDSSDVGVLGRFRLTPGLLIEGELGKTTYEQNLREDRRLGAALVYEIGAYNKLAPYVLAGLGVQQANVGGEFNTTQNFGEIGIGLRYAFTPHFHLTFDVRAGSRNTVSSDQVTPQTDVITRSVAPPTAGSNESEEYTRARLAAVLYF
jgi:hypothetical protein